MASSQTQPTFSSVDNKRLIWSFLVESSYFKGFPASQKDMVKRVLDSVVHEVSQSPTLSKSSINDKNKEVVRQMITYRDLWVQDGTINERNSQPQGLGNNIINGQGQTGVPGYVSQVTAEEIREQREAAFSESLRAKQAEMEGYLNGTRPQNIDFSDKTQDQRIGGDMERLIAEAEAERQRQMNALFTGDRSEAEKWVNGGRPIKIDDSATLPIESQSIERSIFPSSPRRVRFSDDKQQIHPQRNRQDDSDIFAKLKRRPERDESVRQRDTDDRMLKVMEQVRDLLLGISTDIKNIQKIINVSDVSSNTKKHATGAVSIKSLVSEFESESEQVSD